MVLRYDSEIGHLWVKNQKARIPHERGGYLVQTNSSGFRSDVEFAQEKGECQRILFFGDSMTAGDGCSNVERFSDRVGASLGAEVYNYALSGSGTDQQLLLFEKYAQTVEADLVVLCVYVENIQRNMVESRPTVDRATGETVLVPKPFFQLTHEGLKLSNSPVPLERKDIPREESLAKAPPALSLAQKAVKVLRDVPQLQGPMRSILSTKSSDYSAIRSIIPRLTGFQPTPEFDSPEGEACLLLKALIKRFHQACGDRPLLIIPIPTADHVLGRAKANFVDFFSSLASEAQGIHVSDLHTHLMNSPLSVRKQLSFDYDAHYSPFGHSYVADFLTQEIEKRQLLKTKSSPKDEEQAPKSSYILGLSCFYHNSAACLLRNGEIFAAAEEERFTRIKHDRRFPQLSINYCLEEAGIGIEDVQSIVFYDDPQQTLERLMTTIVDAKEAGRQLWMQMAPSWASYKLRIPELVRKQLHYQGPVLKTLHHRSHAASAFFPSPFKKAAILTIDGVGEWTTASIARGTGNTIEQMEQMVFPHSVGLLYSAFTQFLGFKVNSGEYKMMGLAPYGKPVYYEKILSHVVDLAEDGSIRLKLDNFGYLNSMQMIAEPFEELFGPARRPEAPITQRDLDIARSIQAVTEEIVLRMGRHAYKLTGEKYLCLAGGVALNCVANGRLLRESPFDDIWIQPASGDAGGALGAALDVWYSQTQSPRIPVKSQRDSQKGSLLGPAFSNDEIQSFLDSYAIPYQRLSTEETNPTAARLIAEGKVLGQFSGRMEYGPRALGSRSIMGDARNTEMQSTINLKIKYRESFRPFAPAVLEEAVSDFFEIDRPSPYMLLVAPVNKERCIEFDLDTSKDLLSLVRQPRSDVPAITHVDYSARIQSVGDDGNQQYRGIISEFNKTTGYGIVVNTSFNVRGEPIVNTPYDAYRCFMRTEMDVLLLENFLITKHGQPEWREPQQSSKQFDEPNPKLLKQLEHIFDEDLSTATANIKPSLRSVPESGSNWRPWSSIQKASDKPFSFFHVSDDHKTSAAAISENWDNRELAQAIQPALIKMLMVGESFTEDAASEKVPNDMYAMF